jgi:hypothetical protein
MKYVLISTGKMHRPANPAVDGGVRRGTFFARNSRGGLFEFIRLNSYHFLDSHISELPQSPRAGDLHGGRITTHYDFFEVTPGFATAGVGTSLHAYCSGPSRVASFIARSQVTSFPV